MLFLHFLVDTVDMLRPAGYLAGNARLLQLMLDRRDHVGNETLAIQALLVQQFGNFLVQLRLGETERQILQLPLDLPHPQAVGQRGEDFQRLARHLARHVGRAIGQVVHGLGAPSQLHQHRANILDHRQQHLAQRLGLLMPFLRLQQMRLHVMQFLDLAHPAHAFHQCGNGRIELAQQLLLRIVEQVRRGKQQGGGHCRPIQAQLHRHRRGAQRMAEQIFASLRQAAFAVQRCNKLQRLADQQPVLPGISVAKAFQPPCHIF